MQQPESMISETLGQYVVTLDDEQMSQSYSTGIAKLSEKYAALLLN